MVKKSFLLTAIAATFIATVFAESDVIELDETNFESQVLTQETILVEFFAPWCGHCKALAPEYEIAATELKGTLPLAKVDCSKHKDLCLQYGVTGYPTLKIFKSGEPTEYQGIRKSENIIEYMRKQAGPALRELDAIDFEEFKNSDPIVVVGYATDDESIALITKLAEKHRSNYFFGIITDENLAKEHKAQVPSVVVYKKFDDGRDDLQDELTEKSIESFIKKGSVPLLQDINVSNLRYYIESGIALAYMFHDTEEQKQKLQEIFAPIAKKQKGKVNFVYMDGSKYGAHANNVGLKHIYPAFAIQHFEEGTKYPFDQSKEINFENLDQFVQDYVDGNLEATVRSADIPATNDGPIKVVVSKQFSDIVLDTSKDVFLNIYAPWGDYNDEIDEVWKQVGDIVSKKYSSLVIASMDHSHNDLPQEAGFRLTGLPTLVFYKAGSNELIYYDGDRSLQSLIAFINQNNSDNLEIVIPSENAAEEEQVKESTSTHDEL